MKCISLSLCRLFSALVSFCLESISLCLCLGISDSLLVSIVCGLIEDFGEVCILAYRLVCGSGKCGSLCSGLCLPISRLCSLFTRDFLLICKKESFIFLFVTKFLFFVSLVSYLIAFVTLLFSRSFSAFSLELFSFFFRRLSSFFSIFFFSLPVSVISGRIKVRIFDLGSRFMDDFFFLRCLY